MYFLGGDLILFFLYSGYINILVYIEVLILKIEMLFFFLIERIEVLLLIFCLLIDLK